MSYDNNLQHCEPVILDALQQGVGDTALVVTVLADDADQSGLKRHTITATGRHIETLATDNSASEEVLADYLAWAAKTYPAKHYTLTFLDHGGRLDEMCLDTWPGPNATKKWLSARIVGPIIKSFRDQIEGDLDLLFLQQCGRASVENLYNFQGAAPFILASPMTVGAPNTYYKGLLQWLATAQTSTGLELAKAIMSLDDHFTSYVCVDGEVLEMLPSQIATIVRVLVGDRSVALSVPRSPKPCFRAQTESNYDVLQWLRAALQENSRPLEPLVQFSCWLNDSLVLAKRAHPHAPASVNQLCGLSMFVPDSSEALEPYRDYPLYQTSSLLELWGAMHAECAV